eukprot:3674476-Ditylum_brightwellii.AAC.1
MDNIIISKLEWPQHQKLYWRTKELWTSALRNTVSNNAGVLHNSLGEWFPTTEKQQFQFNP